MCAIFYGYRLTSFSLLQELCFEELVRDRVASKVVAELSVIKSVEHLAIVLDTAIFALKDLAEKVQPDDVRCLIEVITHEAGAFPYVLTTLRNHEEKIMLDPRFNSLRQYFSVIKEFIERRDLPEELSSIPWRTSTYNHLRPPETRAVAREGVGEDRYVRVYESKKRKRNVVSWVVAVVGSVAAGLLITYFLLWVYGYLP